jgi:hypothetical protein
MKNALHPIARILVSVALIGGGGLAAAQTTASTTQAAAATAPKDKLVSSFSGFAGSEENAASLVNGLRSGSPVTLSNAGPGGTGETTTFTPPTRPMGYGNVRIAMSLAEAQLASQGITNPTPTQLQGALMGSAAGVGSDATAPQGILQMRASGMGWGQIANSMGFKLGPVMSGKQTFSAAAASGSTTTAAGTTITGSASTTRGKSGVTTASGMAASSKGVTTASGASGKGVTTAAGTSGKGVATAAGSGGGNAYGQGKSSVVTAAGGGSAVATGLGHGNAGGTSAGVVSAAGGAAQASGNAGGQGGGHGKGGGKP